MSITLQLEPGTAASIRGLVAEFGGTLVPLHAGVKDKRLNAFFQVLLPDVEQTVIAHLLDLLRNRAGVAAAYVKPPDEPPT